MKLLYIVPNINNAGGVARVIAIKANYLVEKMNYEVHILTQNNGNSPLFYDYNKKIVLHDIILKGNLIQFFNSYRKKLKNIIIKIQPDIIIVCDNGLKAYTIPFFIRSKIPMILEMHSSIFIQEQEYKKTFLSKIILNSIFLFKKNAVKRYDKFVVETNESILEWGINDGIVIPNPLWFSTSESSNLTSTKVIAVARHTYEKGLDRMLTIWQKIIMKYPDWQLDIYGKSDEENSLQKLAHSLNISNNVTFYNPVKNINDKYLEASFYLMTSRYEGFGMVLIEAMASGLPCIAYDCPCGPRAIINTNENGILIENGNENDFVEAINLLIENKNKRFEMGIMAKKSSEKYNIETIMQKWNALFFEIKTKL
jgi:glycosyltransferase involved in cell wall biosynthesis